MNIIQQLNICLNLQVTYTLNTKTPHAPNPKPCIFRACTAAIHGLSDRDEPGTDGSGLGDFSAGICSCFFASRILSGVQSFDPTEFKLP